MAIICQFAKLAVCSKGNFGDSPEQNMERPKDWRERLRKWLRSIFSRGRLPLWIWLPLAVAIQVPDWKSRLDFWLEAARGSGPVMNAIITGVQSPFFGPGMIVAGIAYLVLFGEPKRTIRHRWAPYFAWGACAVCFVAIAVPSIQGFFRIRVQEAVNELGGAQNSERHLTATQRTAIVEAIKPIASSFPLAITVSAADSPEPTGYAMELMTALAQGGAPVASLSDKVPLPVPMKALNTAVRGIFIQVQHRMNPPHQATLLAQALGKADLRVFYVENLNFQGENFALTVGLK